MITLGTKIRKVSNAVYQEAEPPDSRSQPLEWRRSYNIIELPIADLEISTALSVHEIEDSSLFISEEANRYDDVKPKLAEEVSLQGVVDVENMYDRLYTVGEVSTGEVVEPSRIDGKIQIQISPQIEDDEESDEEDFLDDEEMARHKIPEGIHHGIMFRMDFEPSEFDFCISIKVPQSHILRLVEQLKEAKITSFTVRVYLLSLTYEVDESLGEHWHRRDIVIGETALALVADLNTTILATNAPVIPSDSEDETEQEYDGYEDDDKEIEQLRQVGHLAALQIQGKQLGRLVFAVWVLATAVIVGALI